jgi:hypothetical protein
MLGGINNALWFQSIAGFFVMAFIFIPFLKWAFPSKKDNANKALIRQLRKEIKEIKRK